MDNQQFILSFQNNTNPLISLKNLLLELSNHTNKHISKTAQDVISLIIGYTKNRDYINSIAYCSIYDLRNQSISTNSMIPDFKDALNYVKEPLEKAIIKNSVDIDELEYLAINRREFMERLRAVDIALLNRVNTAPSISQNRDDYISLYDLIEWAKTTGRHSNYSDTASDLLRIIGGQTLQLYRAYGGLKPSIDEDNLRLNLALKFVLNNGGYDALDNFDDEIPF